MVERKEFLAALSKPQKNRLKRYVCGLCEQQLDRTLRYGCAAYYCCDTPCGDTTIITRARDCLAASRNEHIAEGAAAGTPGPC